MSEQVNNSTEGYDAPLAVGQCSSPKTIYRTPFHFLNCILFTVGVVAGFGVLSLLTYLLVSGKVDDKSLFYFCYPFMIVWMCGFTCIPGCSVLYTSIRIDPSTRLITIKSRKMFFCCNKTKMIEIDNVQKFYIKRDSHTHYTQNGVHYDAFKIEILPTNNEVFEVFTGVIDKNNESRKAFEFLRNSLPSNIQIETELNMNY